MLSEKIFFPYEYNQLSLFDSNKTSLGTAFLPPSAFIVLIPALSFHLYTLPVKWIFLSCPQSPADQCKKIHAGDEVIQVNHQTVVSILEILCSGFAAQKSKKADKNY